MLYFQLVIMAGTVMLAYYFEYTDTFGVHVQGFFCYDATYSKPYLGPEERSAIPPILLYAVVAVLPTLLVSPSVIPCVDRRRNRKGRRRPPQRSVQNGSAPFRPVLNPERRNVVNGVNERFVVMSSASVITSALALALRSSENPVNFSVGRGGGGIFRLRRDAAAALSLKNLRLWQTK